MTNTAKNTLLSVVVLSVIAAVSVIILSVANAFFPKYKPSLDINTVALLNSIVPSGVSDQIALDEKYYSMKELDEKELVAFNKENGFNSSNKVLAVYFVEKGEFVGSLVVESQAKGYSSNPEIVMLTAFDTSNKIIDIAVKAQQENTPDAASNIFSASNFAKLRKEIKGKANIDKNFVLTCTSSTAQYSAGGLEKCVNIAAKMVKKLNAAVESNTKTALSGSTASQKLQTNNAEVKSCGL